MKKVFLGFITLVLTLSFFVLSCTTEVIYQESEGSSNKGIVWKGSFENADELENPEYLWAFYNTTDGCSYIYDGEKWTLLASGGTGAGSARTYIRYELNGGNLSDDAPFIYTYGTTLELVEPSYEPYTFEGFYYESDFSGEKITKLDSTHVIGSPLYAKWSYSITYEYKDGRTPYTETIYDINSSYTLSLPDDDSTYWYDEEGHRVTDPTYNTETKKGDAVFYIYPTYTITYVMNGSENDERNVTLYTEMDDVVLYDAKVINSANDTFWGWYLSPSYDETTYITGWKAGEHPEAGNISVYACVISHNIREMENSGTVRYSGNLSNSDLSQIASELQDLYSRKPDIRVTLDLSRTTGLTEIGDTLCYCHNLKSISIPNSVTSIGDYAFANCTSLKSISIPDSVTSIARRAFNGCPSLEDINISESHPSYRCVDGVLYHYSSDKLELVAILESKKTSLTTFTIPNGVTSIGESAFNGCTSLESISIPNGVTSIGESAFGGCTSLESISIPNSVTSIELDAFIGCSNLKSISIPNSVTSIEYRAFCYCTSLESISIPNSVTSIGDYAFYGCPNLKSVIFGNTNGWKSGDTALNPSELASPATAASYLTGEYCGNDWTRED